ncbi:hypothetical protein B0H10DRAFT_1963721 [Mycena sp. CBHHK59/15]|nr:hypothetical protein B0H10DRAFT_1963721 [Mycena sp. CBHHK59/15]
MYRVFNKTKTPMEAGSSISEIEKKLMRGKWNNHCEHPKTRNISAKPIRPLLLISEAHSLRLALHVTAAEDVSGGLAEDFLGTTEFQQFLKTTTSPTITTSLATKCQLLHFHPSSLPNPCAIDAEAAATDMEDTEIPPSNIAPGPGEFLASQTGQGTVLIQQDWDLPLVVGLTTRAGRKRIPVPLSDAIGLDVKPNGIIDDVWMENGLPKHGAVHLALIQSGREILRVIW